MSEFKLKELLPKTNSAETVITLCGSMKNKDAIDEWANKLVNAGYIVLRPMRRYPSSKSETPIVINNLHACHKWKMDHADIIVIINPDGYFGTDTAREIVYANIAEKPVYFLDPPSVQAKSALYGYLEFECLTFYKQIERDYLL